MTLREMFEKETGISSSTCIGLGDETVIAEADYYALLLYSRWLEEKITSDYSAKDVIPCINCLHDVSVCKKGLTGNLTRCTERTPIV